MYRSLIGIVLIGFGYATIFQAALNYLVDTYQDFAASAVAANTFLRCMLAGAFPLTAHPCSLSPFFFIREVWLTCIQTVFTNMGIDWAASLLGFVAVGLIPIPFLFYFFGE